MRSHLQDLEAEAIHIFREAYVQAVNPVLLYSIGKDSSVLLHLARKAFAPAQLPFPLLHIDTLWKFKEMYTFRERVRSQQDLQLFVYVNPEGVRRNINPFVDGSRIHTDIMKTQALKQALNQHKFDVAFGGARRDEESSRAKERIFSFRYIVYEDESWTIDQFDFERDIALAESIDNNTPNALDPNLGVFFSAGGKLIQYHGWIDPQISPNNATQYYERVVDYFGGRETIHDNYRLFMVPGMGHCRGGPGPDSFDIVSVLEKWVENDVAPDSITAEHYIDGTVDRSRPLCPFPEVAVYSGSGNSDDARNFQCRVP